MFSFILRFHLNQKILPRSKQTQFREEKIRRISKYLKLVSKHFPKGSEIGKLFNRSTVKVSYCTTRNFAQHLSAHNKKILAEKKNPKPKLCNCPKEKANLCPFENKCLINGVYRAEVTSNPGSTEKK